MKKLNPIAKCVIVLSCIVFVCGGLLVAANKFLAVSDEARLGRSFSKLFPEAKNIEVETLYDLDSSSVDNTKLTAFNAEVPARDMIKGRVLKAYKLKDDTGTLNGKYVIEAEGAGYKSNSVSHIAFNANGTVYGVTVKSFGASENLSGNIDLSDLNNKIKAASALNEAAGNLAAKLDSSVKPGTGATISMGGVLNATNIASIFLKEVVLGIIVQRNPIELVTNSTVTGDLTALLALDGQSAKTYYELAAVKKNMATIAGVGTGDDKNEAGIMTTYMTDDNQIILRVAGTGYSDGAGVYGAWEVLMLMNSNNLIQAVYIVSNSAGFDDSHGAPSLLNSNHLTAQFKDKSATWFKGNNDTPYSGGVTQTNNGIKVVAYLAVTECAAMRSQVETVVAEHGLPGEEN